MRQPSVFAHRLIDYPRPGANPRERAGKAIEQSDGLVLVWSVLGAQSNWVKAEYEYAKLAGKPVCLIRFPDVEWVDLERVTFCNPGGPFPMPDVVDFYGGSGDWAIPQQGAKDRRLYTGRCYDHPRR